MSNVKPSETAMIMASLRALSNFEEEEAVRTNDMIAACFLPEDRKSVLEDKNERNKIKSMIPKGLYEYVISRTKYIDQVFINAFKNGIEQMVFLGAGYDSRPYRYNTLIGNTKIFEADTKATQEYKKHILIKNGIEIRENITYVGVDFEKDDLFKLLYENGYDAIKRTLFIWEGVTFYLSETTVVEMLKKIRENSIAGSQICFDFQTIAGKEDLISTGIKEEEIKFGIEAGKIDSFVAENGYATVEHINSSGMENKFLTLENGILFGSIAQIMNFLLIEKK
ncbi:class I SAM-dependent methyltransferase [Pseudobacteroides cellulosolvens]|uniref:S-adenosyl-L-methionine-dependent methyltransferase n=1 Tax=Pseudobacteroides cellulosolvens ATCC 35603 = DSM 2933 TaxID=398512 RepID=A0A0L6JR88_9FIRM|nr:SAM-dependent methyltransferase [Pseudobacteroides cellulosolvens]KNY27902.1 methyltransferase [Pseudobacteroides cellulosolvens ATCC 35603 = DSM 2933]